MRGRIGGENSDPFVAHRKKESLFFLSHNFQFNAGISAGRRDPRFSIVETNPVSPSHLLILFTPNSSHSDSFRPSVPALAVIFSPFFCLDDFPSHFLFSLYRFCASIVKILVFLRYLQMNINIRNVMFSCIDLDWILWISSSHWRSVIIIIFCFRCFSIPVNSSMNLIVHFDKHWILDFMSKISMIFSLLSSSELFIMIIANRFIFFFFPNI